MSEITMIGSGGMGSTLVQAFLKGEREVTVRNRSPKKMEPMVQLGARGTADLDEAIEASSRLMICITDYAATPMLLDQPGLPSLLKDRTVIQFSQIAIRRGAFPRKRCARRRSARNVSPQ